MALLRFLFLAVLLAGLARGSEAIPGSTGGASAMVSQPHVTAELIPEKTLVKPGEPFGVILHLHMDAGWHTYWINPGDAGLATTIKWTLPAGFTAGPIQWPTPELHHMGPLITYGYEGDVYLLTTITPPAEGPGAAGSDVSKVEIKAHAEWLVCQEECIPGRGDFEFSVNFASKDAKLRFLSLENEKFFAAARARLPVANTRWSVKGAYGPDAVTLQFTDSTGASPKVGGHLYFFPEQANVLSATEDPTTVDFQRPPGGFSWALALQQNGEKPGRLSGVLVSDEPLLTGGAKAVYISSFPVSGGAGGPAAGPAATASKPAAETASASGPGPSTSLRMTAGGGAAPPAGPAATASKPAAETASASGSGPSTSLRMTAGGGAAPPAGPAATASKPGAATTSASGSGPSTSLRMTAGGGAAPPAGPAATMSKPGAATASASGSGPSTSLRMTAGGGAAPPAGPAATMSKPGAATASASGSGPSTSLRMTAGGVSPPAVPAARSAAAGPEAQPWLIAVLGAAFLGGLILNLMPCVLPVLSLKVFSLMRHAGEDPRGAWKQGAAFTAGVVISFWILAGLLIALQAEGRHLGWGFQMQSPGFVLALIFLFFLLGLNLFGVFELGGSLVGVDAKATGGVGGLPSSFLNGALATLAATPCTAPFMGSSVGFAAGQPAFIALLIFTFLALGMATPYLLLTIFPGALRFVPKPGAWMEAFKQFMGFLLMATVIFLAYVFGALVGEEQVPYLLAALLVAGVAAWIYGRWGGAGHAGGVRVGAVVLALLVLGFAVNWGVGLARATPPRIMAGGASDGWQAWSPGAVAQAVAAKRPVFVDFTAAWCLSCKVNERVALESDAVRRAFAEKHVALFRADWTHEDPAISEVLQRYHRDGVPLYLFYPAGKEEPEVLPEVLTPGIVLGAVGG